MKLVVAEMASITFGKKHWSMILRFKRILINRNYFCINEFTNLALKEKNLRGYQKFVENYIKDAR